MMRCADPKCEVPVEMMWVVVPINLFSCSGTKGFGLCREVNTAFEKDKDSKYQYCCVLFWLLLPTKIELRLLTEPLRPA